MADETEVLEPNTEEQEAAHKAAEERWAVEQTWPIWNVVLTGDEVDYVARAGMNLAEEETTIGETTYAVGDPLPWRAIARCEVKLRAPNKDYAKMAALRAEADAGYHTVESVTEVESV